MINQTVKLFIVAVFMLIPCISFALPGAHDPLKGNQGYVCESCHIGGKNIGNTDVKYDANVCLVCHISGNVKTKKHFSKFDFANLYNNAGTQAQVNPDQTSHKWFGSLTVPGAGALPPTNTNLKRTAGGTTLPQNLSCAGCHSVHGNASDPGTGYSADAPYLRMEMTSDQLCRDCHRSWDTKDHKLGTHPIGVSYTSARNANILENSPLKTTFRTLPITNAINPTGQVKLVNGSVVCSTCHGIHNTDSRTSTFDPYSSTHTYGQLSSSKGYLLRVDAFGKTENDLNICTNCHVSLNHNVKLSKTKPSVQCNDCHSGHVEYDAAYPAELKNVNLVRRYLQYTTAGRVSKRILYRSDVTKEFWNSTKTGVCQACHTPPQNHYADSSQYPNGTFVPNGGSSACSGCHAHTEPSGAFSYGLGGSCSNSCHGLPPTSNSVSGPTGSVSGYTRFSEGNTPHGAHAAGGGPNVNDFECNECHQGYTMPKDDPNSVVEVFISPRTLPGSTATYTKATFACNNVYCHSNGNGIWKSGMNPILWSSAKNSIISQPDECQKCHDDPNSSASHTKHLSFGFGCVTCHAATVANNTTLLASAKVVGGTHTNKIKEVAYSGVGAAVGSSCANVKCHSNGFGAAPNITPTWGTPASGACGACHWTKLTSTVLSTGSHTAHFSFMGGTEQQVCVNCHTTYTSETNPTHVNGVMNTGGTGCAVCHASPYSTASSTPPWGSISTGCGQCHTTVGAFTGLGQSPNTGSHTKHMRIPAAACNQCHAGAVAGVSGGFTHANANVDVTGVGYPSLITKHSAGSNYFTCTSAGAAGCHVNPYSTSAIPTPTWGSATGCASCHTGVGAFTGASNSPATGGHSKHIAKSPLCANCHAGAVSGTSGGNFHIDGNVDVTVVGYTANVTKHTDGSGYSTCSSAGAFACHASPYSTSAAVVAPTWGGTTGCVSCHTALVGAFTGFGSSPNTGSHTKHMVASLVCGNCHAGAVASTSGGNFHSDGNIDVLGGYTANVTKHAQGTYAGSCSTTVCHGSASPTWGANTTNDYCTRCHGTGTATINTANRNFVAPSDLAGVGTGKVSANVKTGAHETHLLNLNGFSNYSTIDYRCESCHGTLPSANTYTHADSTSSPVGKYKTLANKWGTVTGQTYIGTTCANTYCHNPAGTNGTLNVANTGTGVAPSWTNAAYIADGTRKTAANCNQCHKVPGRSGFAAGFAHPGATSDTYVVNTGCTGCHGHDGDSSGTVAGRRHMDGIKYGGGGDCKGCHGYPPLSTSEMLARGAGFVDASANDNGTGNNSSHHLVHLSPSLTAASGKTPCLPCHPDIDSSGVHGQGGSTVSRANVQVNTVTTDYTFTHNSNRSKRYNATTKVCSNISCHFQPTTAW